MTPFACHAHCDRAELANHFDSSHSNEYGSVSAPRKSRASGTNAFRTHRVDHTPILEGRAVCVIATARYGRLDTGFRRRCPSTAFQPNLDVTAATTAVPSKRGKVESPLPLTLARINILQQPCQTSFRIENSEQHLLRVISGHHL